MNEPGIEVSHDPEIPVHLVQLYLCDLCLDGAGGECHTPGCSLWINRAPDLSLRNNPGVTVLTVPRPLVVCLCGSTRFYDEFQQANYDLTMQGVIVLSVGFYPHAKARHGHGEGVGHDSAEKTALDELHKRKIDLADAVLVVSDEDGYFGQSTAGEIAYAVKHGKPVRFAHKTAAERAVTAGLLPPGTAPCREPHAAGHRCFDCATDEEAAAAVPPFPATAGRRAPGCDGFHEPGQCPTSGH